MKKVLLLVLGLGALSSCNQEELLEDSMIKTTDVRINIKSKEDKTSKLSRSTSSDVNRGDIPVTVESIDVVVTSKETSIQRGVSYTIVDDESGEDGFIVGDVPLGKNKFEATTTTVASSIFNFSTFDHNETSQSDKLSNNKVLVPYATYSGSALDQDVVGVNDFISIPMSTDHGRINTIITLAEDIQDEYTLSVVAYTTVDDPISLTTNNNESLELYWSADSCVDGNEVVYDINVVASDGGVVFSTIQTQNVIASTGLNTIYTINANSVEAQSVGLSFSFDPWVEVDGN